jgi:prepilin-type N-terminal cleavage/methylation domain-containing protein
MMRGHTLLELAVVTAILGLLALVGVGSARAQVDRLAVHAAREEVAGMLREARVAARVHGGSRVLVEAGSPIELVVRGDSVLRSYDPWEHGVLVSPRGTRTGAELVYGPTGLGRASSLTLEFERGPVVRSLVVSAYGRLRREG